MQHLYSTRKPLLRRSALAAPTIVMVLGSVAALASTAPSTDPRQFTEFYLLGEAGKLGGYPSALQIGEPFTVTLGVANHEGVNASYIIRLPFGRKDTNVKTPVIQDGDRWEVALQLTAPAGDGPTKLEFNLYRQEDPETAAPYRSLHLFVNITDAATP